MTEHDVQARRLRTAGLDISGGRKFWSRHRRVLTVEAQDRCTEELSEECCASELEKRNQGEGPPFFSKVAAQLRHAASWYRRIPGQAYAP